MCGLAGLIAWDDRFRATPDLLARMSQKIAHRGPDGQGVRLIDGPPQVALIHRRLAILDPDPRANQPFSNDLGQSIVYNGEIYNFRDLHRELSSLRPDYAWRTTCDTEVLLLAWSTWKEDCLSRLEGMFAFAIHDPLDHSLFLARDRMGQKPLFYAHQPGQAFAFASEIPPLLQLPWITADIDPQHLSDYLTWGFCPAGTIYRTIQKLPPGHSMRITQQALQINRWFCPNQTPARNTHAEPDNIARTRELILSAVKRQLIADVPLGCFLSGGIDSSIIAAAMRQAIGPADQLLTFSIGFDDPRYDETRYAAQVARHLGTQHRQFIVHPNAAEDLPKVAAVFGEPFADSSALPTHYLARETRQHVKVALSGDGGDELFGGYDRYRALLLGQRFKNPALFLRSALRFLPGTDPKTPQARIKRFLATLHLPPAQRYGEYLKFFDAPLLLQLLGDHSQARIRASQSIVADAFSHYLGPRDLVEAALATDRAIYLPDDLLAKVDRCSMLHALEVRSPFMDHTLIQFAAALPTSQLIAGGSKRLLRKAFAPDLPPTVFTRRKMGFAVPIGRWFRTTLRPLLTDTLLSPSSFSATHFHLPTLRRILDDHLAARADHTHRLYALLMLELWHRQHAP